MQVHSAYLFALGTRTDDIHPIAAMQAGTKAHNLPRKPQRLVYNAKGTDTHVNRIINASIAIGYRSGRGPCLR